MEELPELLVFALELVGDLFPRRAPGQRVLRELIGAFMPFVTTPTAHWSFTVALGEGRGTNELTADTGILARAWDEAFLLPST